MTDRMAAAPLRLSLFAPNGRMGNAIRQAATESRDVDIVEENGDVLVDFSAPAALQASLARARSSGQALLIGTTGLDSGADAEIAEAAGTIPILRAANTSLGVALLSDLVERAARSLGPDWDIEILEMHHRLKADAPSGTALALGAAAARGRGVPFNPSSDTARHGTSLERAPGAIGFASLRGGTVVGDHTVVFAGPAERIELVHKAEDRMIFARGAVKAALWAHGQKPGLYSMADVLGL